MVIALNTSPAISVGDTETISASFGATNTSDAQHLDVDPSDGTSELLTGTPTFVEQTTSDLTIGSKQINTVAYRDKRGKTIAIGQAAQCSVSGGNAANSPYTIRLTVSTDATPARTFVRDIYLTWE